MKARVRKTGEIVEAEFKGFDNLNVEHYIINGNQNWILSEFSLEFLESAPNPDYWTRLEHIYAGMAMQGLVTRGEVLGSSVQEIARDIAEISCEVAHALVEKMKEERK